MNIILLSGGSGKRLWPLSNDVRSKQFLKILSKSDGSRESMAQRMYRMIKAVDSDATVTIATSENQIPQIKAQLGDNINISVEPCRRDTFPAIALAAAYLKKCGVGPDEPVVVCPVDPYVNEDYFECLKKLSDEAGKANLTLMGIEPIYPATKYGYIIPETKEPISAVKEFKEKPDEATAAAYISQGALWNGGVFAFKLSYLLGVARDILGSDDYDDLYTRYDTLTKISFDYAVAEKERSINVIRFGGEWKDLGTWNTLTEAMLEPVGGNAVADGCHNTHIINELGLPMIVLGMDDAVVAATPDGILVSDKEASKQLKDYVEDQRPMYERRQWGEYRVLDQKLHDDGQNSLVKELVISPGKSISYQRHERRTEIWTIMEGSGKLVLDDVVTDVSRGMTIAIAPGVKHAIKATDELHIIEVQMGDELVEDDIEHLEWDW